MYSYSLALGAVGLSLALILVTPPGYGLEHSIQPDLNRAATPSLYAVAQSDLFDRSRTAPLTTEAIATYADDAEEPRKRK